MHLKMLSEKCHPFLLCLSVIKDQTKRNGNEVYTLNYDVRQYTKYRRTCLNAKTILSGIGIPIMEIRLSGSIISQHFSTKILGPESI